MTVLARGCAHRFGEAEEALRFAGNHAGRSEQDVTTEWLRYVDALVGVLSRQTVQDEVDSFR